MFVFGQPLPFSLTIGAIAYVTLMVLKQYIARLPIVNTLILVVGIDDAIAQVLMSGTVIYELV